MQAEPLLYKNLLEQLSTNLEFLPDKPEETTESTLRALWHKAAGSPMSAELACERDLPQLDEQNMAMLQALVVQRISGIPLAHLTGRQRFMSLEMLAGPMALVPRKETELLARAAVDIALQITERQGSCNVLDVCTGSGNVALAIAHHVEKATIYAADISEDAIALAKRNAGFMKLDNRTEFRAGDLLTPFDTPDFWGQIDLLTCNPPYINSTKVGQLPGEISNHEPDLAFNGGPFGVSIMMRLIQEAPRFLRAGGWLAFEVGLGQGPGLVKRMERSPSAFNEIRTIQDNNGATRVLLGRC